MKKVLALFFLGITATTTFADNTNTTIKVHAAKKNSKRATHVNQNPEKPLVSDDNNDKSKEKEKEDKYPWLKDFSGYMAFTSNYVYRGISQTENLPAIQGSLTYSLPLGLYLNVWASNVKFPDTDATIEIDTIAGVKGDFIKEVFSYDINIDRYNYPGAQALSYNELNSVFNIYFIQLGYSYSQNAYNFHNTGVYYNAGISTDIPSKYFFGIEDVSIQALVGRYNLSCKAGCAYTDYNVSLSKKFKNYTLTAQWTDTNHGQHAAPYDTSKIIGTVTANF